MRSFNLWWAGLTLLCLTLAARYIDRRPFADFGFGINRRWVIQLLLGLLVGFVVTMLPSFAMGWLGHGRLEYVGDRLWAIPLWIGVSTGFASLLVVGFWEETLWRGHLTRNMSEGLEGGKASRSRPAMGIVLAIPALAFACYHFVGGWEDEFHLFQVADEPTESYLQTEINAAALTFLIATVWLGLRLRDPKFRTPLADYQPVTTANPHTSR